eukprot:TRINITY_DN5661_c0_g1_i3.p1 TRINITY_DN5661_c0_g1~~TRINITY_DN5661_c0_g1_i3.p1  ORF type:complete len:335 (+),score=42.51 TRINITY_DN5661_c0_g1_i3:100-1104(+)
MIKIFLTNKFLVKKVIYKMPAKLLSSETIDKVLVCWMGQKPIPSSDPFFALSDPMLGVNLPCFIDGNGLQSVIEFLKEQTESNVMTLFMYPGVGKTSVVKFAAAYAERLYLRITANSNFMKDLKASFEREFTTKKNFSIIRYTHKLSYLTLCAFQYLIEELETYLDKEKDHTKKFSIGSLPFTSSKTYPHLSKKKTNHLIAEHLQLRQNLRQRYSKLLEKLDPPQMVIHFDEVQLWKGTTPTAEFKRKKSGFISKNEKEDYFLSIFSEVAMEIIEHMNIKVIYSGTLQHLNNYFRISSSLKICVTDVVDVSREMVAFVWDLFFKARLEKSKDTL